MEFKHFAHSCNLTFREVCEEEKETIRYPCYMCREVIYGPAYTCESCPMFNLHKSCAKLPSQIITHPLHPHHPLTSIVEELYKREPFICDGCNDYSYVVSRFSCQECAFNLDIKCASSMDRRTSLQKMDRKASIDHFSHEHTLQPYNARKLRMNTCACCNEIIDGPGYVCLGCCFFMHESCTKFPREITHPLHPHHHLTIAQDKKKFICNGCRYVSYGSRYSCRECGYNLDFDLKCGSSIEDYFSMCNRETLQEMDKKGNVNHFCHKHTLTLCNIREGHEFHCNYCNRIIDGSAYVCLDCSFYFHELCTTLPAEITHPHHPLTLILQNPEFTCDGCKKVHFSASKFYCNLCPFNLDVKCASLMDDFFPQTLEKTERKININHFSHKHTLRLCNSSNIYKVNCCYCYKTIHGSAYVCRSCEFYIHESCKDRMQEEVQHPFHKKHYLRHEHIAKGNQNKKCSACKRSISYINLTCWHCHIDLHPACAKPTVRPLKLKHKFHECHLFYFGHDELSKKFRCRICKGKSLHASVYRCVDCKVNIHVECIPIPPIVEIQCHEHPLTLLDSVKDYHFKGEYYCDICEEKGNSNHHLYYCEECIYIAHIECVITEDYTLIAEETEQDTEKNDEVQGKDPKVFSFEQAVHTLDDTSLEELSYLAEQHSNAEDKIDEAQEVDIENKQKTHGGNCSLEQTMKDENDPYMEIRSYLSKQKLHDVIEDETNDEMQESNMEKKQKSHAEKCTLEQVAQRIMKEEEGESSLVYYQFLDHLNKEMGDLCLNIEYPDDQVEEGDSSLVCYQFLGENDPQNFDALDKDMGDSKGMSSMVHHQYSSEEDGQDLNLCLRLGY